MEDCALCGCPIGYDDPVVDTPLGPVGWLCCAQPAPEPPRRRVERVTVAECWL